LATARAFAPDVVEKVTRLCQLLSDIHMHPYLGSRLVLKGGTALNLFYLEAPRLSVDADLNYVGAVDAETMASERPLLRVALRAVSEGQGCRVTEGPEAHASSAFILSYRNEKGSQDSLKLEVNYMYRVCLGQAQDRQTHFAAAGPTTFRLVPFAELVGGKLVALLDRAAPRDLYDAAALSQIVDPLDPAFRRVFVAMAGVLPRAIWEYHADRVERVTELDIRENLYPVLAIDDHPQREELLGKVVPWLQLWLTLDKTELEFHQRLNGGAIEGRLLFPEDPMMAAAVDAHPGLRWKVTNVAKMLGTTGAMRGREGTEGP
jgi:predicted nucleotidyltransferase component of viral defense system